MPASGSSNPFGSRSSLTTSSGQTYTYYRLPALAEQGFADLDRLPITIRILLENVLRHASAEFVEDSHIEKLARWNPSVVEDLELPFMPGRVLLQDFTGVPVVVDLASMRSAVARLGGDVTKINPLVPVDLVIDHSVQVDRFGTLAALAQNTDLEYERNKERYALFRWAQGSFQNLRVVPPGTGIVHQVNLEYLAPVVLTTTAGGETTAFPDTLVGTDSHTTMINGLGVLGWGVGGIEAEAVMLGQPLYQLMPEVVGVRMTGALQPGVTATDLVLTITELLRKFGVVGKFVEFFGQGLSSLPLADRATIANMAPEYGPTAAIFPVDDETLAYLRMTGRPAETIDLVERYMKAQGLFRTDATPDPVFNSVLDLDLASVVPSVAGPRRPQDRVILGNVQNVFRTSYPDRFPAIADVTAKAGVIEFEHGGEKVALHHGSVAIAAITSCTNTSNPSVMIGAGLLARNAVERGLHVSPTVKTSLAPGSQVVTRYLEKSNLLPYLEALGFHVVGYGCTTCIGNSGPLPAAVAQAIDDSQTVVASVISGNRNFEGRVHPQVRASFLASPPLVVAYALAGTVDIDLENDPIGHDPNGDPVFLKDIWPTGEEIQATIGSSIDSSMYASEYGTVFEGDDRWKLLPVPTGALYAWDDASTYVKEAPYFVGMSPEPGAMHDIAGARVLAMLGDSVTTDHISPAGSISKTSPAAGYLRSNGIEAADFNSYGSRRGNHEVMIRGTFANIRLKNGLVPGSEGNVTVHLPTGEQMSIFEASERYIADGTPLVVLAGKEYGTGSSRDWAAKGTLLLGVKAVIAESFERIHRSNLVGMGVLPLQYQPGETAASLGLTGTESYRIDGITTLAPKQLLTVTATAADGSVKSFQAVVRIDSSIEVEYYRNGGILQTVLRRLMA